MKCDNCGKRMFRKFHFCPKCGSLLMGEGEKNENVNISSEIQINEEKEDFVKDMSKAVFITEGLVFNMVNHLQVLGVALAKISVGDVVIMNGQRLQVEGIAILRSRVNEVEQGKNCALVFKGLDFERFKRDLQADCRADQESKSPIQLGSNKTTQYTFFFRP